MEQPNQDNAQQLLEYQRATYRVEESRNLYLAASALFSYFSLTFLGPSGYEYLKNELNEQCSIRPETSAPSVISVISGGVCLGVACGACVCSCCAYKKIRDIKGRLKHEYTQVNQLRSVGLKKDE